MKPYAYVRLADAASGGTIVSVTVSSTLSGRIFWGLWFGFAILWTSLGVIGFFQQGGPDALFPLFGGGFVAFGLLFNAFGRAIAHGDGAFLLGFLVDELRLEEPPPGAAPIG